MKIGFIGTGKIAKAVVESICTSRLKDYLIYVSPRNESISRDLAGKYAVVNRENSNQDVIDKSEVIFIALRPPIYR